MKRTVTIELRMPSMPNFLRSDDDRQCLDIGDLAEDEVRAFAAEWTEELVRHARKRREAKAERDAAPGAP